MRSVGRGRKKVFSGIGKKARNKGVERGIKQPDPEEC